MTSLLVSIGAEADGAEGALIEVVTVFLVRLHV